MAKTKAKIIMVQIKSMISGHCYNIFRERLGEKLELIRYDPWVRKDVVYREAKKIRSMKF